MDSTFVSFVSFVVKENVLRYAEDAHGERLQIRVNSWQKIANNTQSEHYQRMRPRAGFRRGS